MRLLFRLTALASFGVLSIILFELGEYIASAIIISTLNYIVLTDKA